MVAPEYHRAYRRGIVLGLSLAELFILLVFLLLLALIGYALSRDDQATQQAQTIADQREQLDALAPIVDADPNSLRQRIEQLAREKSDAEKRAEEAEQRTEQQAQTIAEQQQSITQLEHKKEHAEARARESEQRAESAEAARQAAEQKHQQAKQNEKGGEVLGQDSPCWYTVVQGQDGKREKPVYIFDVRMRDKTVLVQEHYRSPPPDAHTPPPKYNSAALGRELPYAEFMREFKPLAIAGRNKQVRDRKCYFHVQLWKDTTSGETAFDNFNDYVRAVFVPTLIKRDLWPH